MLERAVEVLVERIGKLVKFGKISIDLMPGKDTLDAIYYSETTNRKNYGKIARESSFIFIDLKKAFSHVSRF